MRATIEKKRPGMKVGYHHFAFFRGHLNGVSLETLGDRYLESGTDLRQARRTLEWIRGELVAAARRYQHDAMSGASLARLLRIPSERLKAGDSATLEAIPTLEDFQAVFDPQGFYSEGELIEEFERRYSGEIGAAVSKRASRNERLRRKLLDSVAALEAWIATVPKATDPIAIWIEPIIADRLLAVGIVSIDDLVALINRKGNLWYRKIPKFGAIRARRMLRWLDINRVVPVAEWATVPYRIAAAALPAQRNAAFGIVPFERLQLTADLDGSSGTNRCTRPQIAARHDRDAIETWLALKCENMHTRRAYVAQVERFLLWLINEKARALSSAGIEDCNEYAAFLSALDAPGNEWPWRLPRSAWIGERGVKRWHPDWKPFAGRMAPASRRHAILILKGLFSFLAKVRYLEYDPWTQINTPKKVGARIMVDHVLNERQWRAVIDELEHMPKAESYFRLRLLLWLAYSTGLRLDELIRLTVKELVRVPDGTWELAFIGKGAKERQVPLDCLILEILCDYMEARGHGRDPAAWLKVLPVITSLQGQFVQKTRDLPLAPRTLHQILKSHFHAAADRLDDLFDQAALRQASTHWLRHTFSTELIARGADMAVVQDLLGHDDSATTALYAHTDRKRRQAAVTRLLLATIASQAMPNEHKTTAFAIRK